MLTQTKNSFAKFIGFAGMVGGLLFGTVQKAEASTIPVQPAQAKNVQFQLPSLGVGAQRDSAFQANKSPYLALSYKAHVDLDYAQQAPDNEAKPVAQKKVPRGYTQTTYRLTADNKRLAAVIEKHEMDVPYPYLDVKGNFTVGRGFAAFNVREAQQFPFYLRNKKTGKLTNQLASPKQIADNYKKLKKEKYGKGIYAYTMKHVTNISMRQSDIDKIYEQKMTIFLSKLEKDVPKFQNMPIPGQIALADISWQTGRITPYHEVKDKHGHVHYKRAWKSLTSALDQGNLSLAAKHSYRPDASGVRNRDTKLLFAEAQAIIKADRVRLAAIENQEMLVQNTDNNPTAPAPVLENKAMFSKPTLTGSAPVFTSQLVDLRQ